MLNNDKTKLYSFLLFTGGVVITFLINWAAIYAQDQIARPRVAILLSKPFTTPSGFAVVGSIHNYSGDFEEISFVVPSNVGKSDLSFSESVGVELDETTTASTNFQRVVVTGLPPNTVTTVLVPLPSATASQFVGPIATSRHSLEFARNGIVIDTMPEPLWRAVLITAIYAIFFAASLIWFYHVAKKIHANIESVKKDAAEIMEQLEDSKKSSRKHEQAIRKQLAFRNLRFYKSYQALHDENTFWRSIALKIVLADGGDQRDGLRWLRAVRNALNTRAIDTDSVLDSDQLTEMLEIESKLSQSTDLNKSLSPED
ncbi:MAG: hypothetical protein KIT54_12560 [Phycisphaeraceae bacterium]|nr:hypothetical protein [Phycisphaeraceae bacterium]